ncbi:preprotein translocase subunit SecY [Candidatus Saccharibacteria bacterium]|nr:MAG: preprotein translocase subunit SecY [Candidatus Saccharibacteria bacterium]PID99331.1 MAG: preprotein translocase subunit SecY [Candidatus Saccharibacteria bacterium]
MNWKIIGASFKQADMRKRIFGVLAILLIFRILAHIPVPLADPQTLKQVLTNLFNEQSNTPQLLGFINVLSGGALANFSIMIAGLGPYINASIIMQLLTKALPKLENMRKDGESGQKKINQYTRMLTFPLAIVQAIGSIYLVRQYAQRVGGIGDITANTSMWQWVLMVAALTGGSMLLMWMGELVTEKSVGNGISLLITVGIVSALPGMISQIASSVYDKTNKWELFGRELPINQTAFWFALAIMGVVLLVTWIVVMLNEAARRLTINYAKRVQGNRAYGGVTTTLPVKLITAGVVPIIFAIAFLSVPGFVGQLMTSSSNPHWAELGHNLTTWFQNPTAQTFAAGGWQSYIYPGTYFMLVFLFTFFYTSITFNTREIAENLQKQGGFIEGVRSGSQTERYLAKTVNKITLFGAACLGLLAIMPIIAQIFVPENIALALGGTSVLILVAVSLETLRAVESRALMITYDQYSRDDFFYDSAGGEESGAITGKRLRFMPKKLSSPKRRKK